MRIFSLLIFGLFSMPVFSLGNLGHELVCEIAYRELTPAAKQAVDRLLMLETNSRYKTFGRACTWADDKNGGRTKQRSADHYVNVPRDWSHIKDTECVLNSHCLFSAIRQDSETLRSQANDGFKLIALKYLAHWLGDIHQPLHVSFQDDYGGNDIRVNSTLSCENLHALWDRCLPESLMRVKEFNPRSSKQKKQFAALLQNQVTAAQRSRWLAGNSVTDWADESLQITRQASTEYCYLNNGYCQYSSEQRSLAPHAPKDRQRILLINDEYYQHMQPLMTTRLQQAGIRLGALLNSIFQ